MENKLLYNEAVQIIQKHYPNYNQSNISAFDYVEVFITACANNKIDIIEAILILVGKLNLDNIIHANKNRPFKMTVKEGNYNIALKLLELTSDSRNKYFLASDYGSIVPFLTYNTGDLNKLVERIGVSCAIVTIRF